jgi:hypothetical protein
MAEPAVNNTLQQHVGRLRAVATTPGLGVMAYRVGILLLSYADLQTGACWPSTARLANELQTDERRVRRALRELEEANLLTTDHVGGGRCNTSRRTLKAAPARLPNRGTSDPGTSNPGTSRPGTGNPGQIEQETRVDSARKPGSYVPPRTTRELPEEHPSAKSSESSADADAREPVTAAGASPDSAEPDEPDDPVLLTIPVVGKGKPDWPLVRSHVDRLAEEFPGVDVPAEAKKARGWCIDNPTKRKTANGMPKFLRNWMERHQNRGGSSTATFPVAAEPPPDERRRAALARVQRAGPRGPQ